MKILSNLINQELSLIELDNIMIENLFYSIMDDGIIDNIKQDKNIYYLSTVDNESAILINFEIVIDNEPEEASDNFILKVLEVGAA